MKFKTESGSVYEVEPGRVRRVSTYSKRGDNTWVRLKFPPEVALGCRAVLILESLAPLGPDDVGTVRPDKVTIRTTTPVTKIWE